MKLQRFLTETQKKKKKHLEKANKVTKNGQNRVQQKQTQRSKTKAGRNRVESKAESLKSSEFFFVCVKGLEAKVERGGGGEK